MSEAADFLVQIEIDTGDLPEATVERLRKAEARRARELANQGTLRSLWRVPGRWANVGIWRVQDEAALADVLAGLPLHPYMTLRIQKLAPHPSDPTRGAAVVPVVPGGRGAAFDLVSLAPMEARGRSASVPAERLAMQLEEIPELVVRGRVDFPANVSEPEPAVSPELVVPTAVWADLDVTEAGWADRDDHLALVRAIAEAAVDVLRSRERAQEAEFEVAWTGLTRVDIVRAVVGRPNESYAHGTKPIALRITDASGLEVDGSVSLPSVAAMHLSSGPLQRVVRAVPLADGGEAIQVRSVMRVALAGHPDSVEPGGLGAFFSALRSRLLSGLAGN